MEKVKSKKFYSLTQKNQPAMQQKNDLSERLFVFAVEVMKYLKTIPNSIENNVIKYQLGKSAPSSGANYEESQAGSSRADFINKVKLP